jgi:phytoene synthase
MTIPPRALAHCRSILDRSGSSFALAFRVLPRDQRAALTAFYAFCRQVDDAVDDAADPAGARAAVRAWRERVARAFSGGADDPLGELLGWAAARFGIRREHVDLVLDGVEQDVDVIRFARFDELYEYCYRVASAVGLVCVTVTGDGLDGLESYAELTGVAVQLTNVLRDVGDDAARNRIYLPLEDLRAFGVAEREILERRPTPRVRALLRFEAARARAFYDLAGAALPHGHERRLFFCEALRQTYSRLLDEVVRRDFPLDGRRVSLAGRTKLAVALRHRLGLVRRAGAAA